MSTERSERMTEERQDQIVRRLTREAIATVSPERTGTYGDAAVLIKTLRTDLATATERLRVAEEGLEAVRAKAIHHDPEYTGQRTNGPMPRWNGIVKMIDTTLSRLREGGEG